MEVTLIVIVGKTSVKLCPECNRKKCMFNRQTFFFKIFDIIGIQCYGILQVLLQTLGYQFCYYNGSITVCTY